MLPSTTKIKLKASRILLLKPTKIIGLAKAAVPLPAVLPRQVKRTPARAAVPVPAVLALVRAAAVIATIMPTVIVALVVEAVAVAAAVVAAVVAAAVAKKLVFEEKSMI